MATDLQIELAGLACEWNERATALESRARLRPVDFTGGRLTANVRAAEEAATLRRCALDLESLLAIHRETPCYAATERPGRRL